jgi:hypothetical protein
VLTCAFGSRINCLGKFGTSWPCGAKTGTGPVGLGFAVSFHTTNATTMITTITMPTHTHTFF